MARAAQVEQRDDGEGDEADRHCRWNQDGKAEVSVLSPRHGDRDGEGVLDDERRAASRLNQGPDNKRYGETTRWLSTTEIPRAAAAAALAAFASCSECT